MTATLLYTSQNVRPAYQLRFSWTCWPTAGCFFPPQPESLILQELEAKWEGDGIRRLESRWTPEMIQYTVSVTPQVSPVFLAGRLKGRLQHALRKAGTPVDFRRKLAIRSIGNVRTTEIEAYIENQVVKHQFADQAMEARFKAFTIIQPTVNLTVPMESNSGRYWYNLHLVFVFSSREQNFDQCLLRTITEECSNTAVRNGYLISRQSLLPDHLHLALRGRIEHSPEVISLEFLNSLASAVGGKPIWNHGYYAGTFGEYDMGSVSSCQT